MKKKLMPLLLALGLVATSLTACNGNAAVGPQGPKGDTGETGQPGVDGVDGLTPYIGENGNWFIGDTDTDVKASGTNGVSIVGVVKTGTEGNVDTYTITFSNGETFTFTITNGTNGEQGPKGDTGTRGSIWFTGNGKPNGGSFLYNGEMTAAIEGDMYYNTLGGNIYQYRSYNWVKVSHIGTSFKNVKSAANEYMHSDAFIKSVITTYNGNAAYLNSYLRYVDGVADILTKEVNVNGTNKTILHDYMETVILDKIKGFVAFDDEGNVTDPMTASDASASTITGTGWYSLVDFSFSWGSAYALYDAYLLDQGKSIDTNPYKLYKDEFIRYMGTGWYNDYFADGSVYGALSKAKNAYASVNSARTATAEEAIATRLENKTTFLEKSVIDHDACVTMFGEENTKVLEWVFGLARGLVSGSLNTPAKILAFDAEHVATFNEDTTTKWNNAEKAFFSPANALRNYINGLEDKDVALVEYDINYNTIMNNINSIMTYLASSSSSGGISRNGPLMANRASFGFSAQSMVAPALALVGAPMDCPTLVYCGEAVNKKQHAVDGEGHLVNSTSCNWVGVSGVPLLATLYTEESWFSVDYEKAHQAYYPTKNGWNFPWADYITMDLGMNQFDRFAAAATVGGSGIDSRYMLLNAISFGIDIDNYVKSVETGDSKSYSYYNLWMDEFIDETRTFNYADLAMTIALEAAAKGIAHPGMNSVANPILKIA